MENTPPPKKLTRIKEGQIIAGVCTGLAKYFNVDVVLVRVVFVALLFAGGSGVLLYILLALIIPPDDSSHEHKNVVHEQKSEQSNHHSTEAASSNSGDTVKEFVDTMKDNAQKVAEEVRDSHGSFSSTLNIAGVVIVAVGVLALFNSLTGFRVFRWDLLWPIVLIFIGAFILFKKAR